MSVIAVTCGDVNGIGVEVALKAVQKLSDENFNGKFVFIVPQNVFEKAADEFNIELNGEFIDFLFLENVEIEKGKPTEQSGKSAYEAIMKAYDLIAAGTADAMVTAPISKEAFALAGIKFKGHTDLLGKLAGTENYLMTFVSEKFNTALATVHIPVSEVPSLLSTETLYNKIKTLSRSAQIDFGIAKPSVAVLGLNPHAGENGTIGSEETEIIAPAIEKLRSENIDAQGPFVPDAFFARKNYERFDFVFGMYHDQVLIPFKMLNFDKGVNFTAGLPFVRTSPDHGTAYDIAWQNVASYESMLFSITLADKIVRNRNENR